jgi:hypothetical protein
LLIDINSPSFPSLGRACITTPHPPLPCTVTTKKFRALSLFFLDLYWF